MTDLTQALAEISEIRAQVARGTQFRGYGPASIAVSGTLALIVAAAQALWMKDAGHEVVPFLAVWVATAAVSVALTTFETIVRSRRVHSGFASEMIQSAVEQFLPATIVGLLLTGVMLLAAPKDLWMLPGLWELIFSLGVFASCRFLPRQMFGVGLWYLVCGLTCLMMASGPRVLSPWEMGIPFGVGQLLVAAVLRYGFEEIA
jgi:type IV secretory pathway TrbD component